MDPSAKPYELTLEQRPDYMYAHISCGAINSEIVTDYLHQVIDRCHKKHCSRLMIERDIPATLSDTDIFFTGNEFAHMGIEQIRIAFVDSRVENKEHLEFAMLIANNRGANMKLFANAAEAEKWLQGA